MVHRVIALVLALTMMGALTAGAAAQHGQGNHADQTTVGSATGLVAAVVGANVALQDVDVEVVEIEITDSLNNLLRDSRILNNLLRNADIEVNVIQVGDITVDIENVLNNNDIDILNDNVVAVGVLSGGLIVFTNP